MAGIRLRALIAVLTMLAAAGCAKRQPPAPAAKAPAPAPARPPAPPQNIFALLPDPEHHGTAIVVTNSGGSREIREVNQAVRVDRADAAPTAPFTIEQAAVRRLFGTALDAIPDPGISFLLYFDEASDTLNSTAQAAVASIVRAVRDRHSTDVSVTGHTDRTGSAAENYRLGLRRAERVAEVLRRQGVDVSSLFVSSHGESDPLIPTGPGVAEERNRRVEVIVH
jgi:outer membrane protein OmpA-like peptidoglycan-associated protein